jgi:hypothetical protein
MSGLGRILANLLASVPSSLGRVGSDLRRSVGDLLAASEEAVRTAALGAPLLAASRPRAAGASFWARPERSQ